ncbi:MAG TPA: glycosyltransferase [Stellaceae bacterium]|nr:glycosyltransferase [Stellaceae bacterium]
MTSNRDFPRLLFVTPHAFNHVTGGGVAFSNLFRDWPPDRLATVHNDPEPTSYDVCRKYFTLSPAELDLAEPFAMLRHWLRKPKHQTSQRPVAGASDVTLVSAAKGIGVRLLGSGLPERAHLTPALERWIADFKPDVLYTILGSNGMMELVEAIRERFKLPLVVHIMDDWPEASYRHGMLARRERPIMERRLTRLFARAAECLAISPAMAEAYAQRYGRPFRHFQNTIDVGRWRHAAKVNLAVGRPAELLYVGSIFPNAQLQSLVDCAEAVAKLSRDGYPIKLSIATPSGHGDRYRRRLAIDPAIRIEETIADDETFYKRIAAADALLVPVNFDADSIRFIRYSMPAKLPAYMVSGTPILVYGPPDITQVQYAMNEKWGHVVDRRDPAALATGLRAIIEDMALRRRVTAAARETVERHHEAVIVRPAFQSVLMEAARTRAAACA